MPFWHNQDMPLRHGIIIVKRHGQVVLEDYPTWRERAKNTIRISQIVVMLNLPEIGIIQITLLRIARITKCLVIVDGILSKPVLRGNMIDLQRLLIR